MSRYIVFLMLLLNSAVSFGAGIPGEDAGFVLRNLSGSFTGIAGLLFSVCIAAGLSFGVAAMFKFKQHKDNPAQVSVGQAIGLFFLGALMIWLPFLIKTMGFTITGAQTDTELMENQNKINQKGKDSGFGKYLIPGS